MKFQKSPETEAIIVLSNRDCPVVLWCAYSLLKSLSISPMLKVYALNYFNKFQFCFIISKVKYLALLEERALRTTDHWQQYVAVTGFLCSCYY